MQRIITLLLILLPVSINAQEQELAKVAFNINLTELHRSINGRMYSLGEVNFIQGMHDFGNPKNSIGLKPNS